MALSTVEYGEHRCNRARRVSGDEKESDRSLPDVHNLPIMNDAFRVRHAAQLSPVRFRDHHAQPLCAEVRQPAGVIIVKMSKNDQLDLTGIQSEFAHSRYDDVRGLVRIIERVEQNEPIRGLQDPGPDIRFAYVIKVVE